VLNPRIPLPLLEHPLKSFDIKTFLEIRVGLINWLLFDIGFLAKQYERYGYVSDSMWLIVAFQSFYVVDALYFEEAFFSTMDVAYCPSMFTALADLDRTDGSGFMLDMGNLVWVAMFYCLQARYLVLNPVHLGPYGIAGVLVLKGLGYYIFRSANLQKDRFKADDPSVKGMCPASTPR
jgi:Delta14-sterol reductase